MTQAPDVLRLELHRVLTSLRRKDGKWVDRRLWTINTTEGTLVHRAHHRDNMAKAMADAAEKVGRNLVAEVKFVRYTGVARMAEWACHCADLKLKAAGVEDDVKKEDGR